MPTKRLFVAIPLPEYVKDDLLSTIPRGQNRDIRWTDRDNLHFTLSFLGDREEADLDDLCNQVAAIAANRYPFRMVFKGFKTMYKDRRPSMVWAVFRESPSYLEFAAEFGNAMGGDLHTEPIAHVTLGRVRASAGKFARTPKMNHIVPFELDIDHIELWESKFGDYGINYSLIKRFEMRAEPMDDEEE
ncbi:MAG: RNA 2',3'-cyclic phosphodiesterase [Bacteroidetes bacterium]|jgi:2'-5' RNA ligase|nr:RNA 2',3'-cyclic phosphodiesterase [Bacteroidota bacterium]